VNVSELSTTNDLLELANIDAGRITLNCQPLDCLEVMTEVYRSLEAPAQERSAILTADTSINLPYVLADRERLIQILLNLGQNAIQYNIEDGWVLLSAHPHHGMVRFIVRDTGSGIAKELFPQIFQPFSRPSGEAATEKRIGLGLAIARKLAQAMNGRVGFESLLGQGSKFWVDLPIAEQAAAKPGSPSPFVTMGDARRKVLYIEDKIPNIELMRDIIEELRTIQFIDAQTVEDGVQIARSVIPDLVITDIHLPDGKGFDVLRRLRADSRTAHVPVFALSADAMTTNLHNMERAGFDRIITKPFEILDLMDIIRRHLQAA
jgi:CheY-like chemotaxis protein